MKNNSTTKKVWQKPEVSDLDVKNTASGTKPTVIESTTSYIIS
jgi:hypothetical protein|nr:hypothetical protein [uncultured Flavobacterium sp.]